MVLPSGLAGQLDGQWLGHDPSLLEAVRGLNGILAWKTLVARYGSQQRHVRRELLSRHEPQHGGFQCWRKTIAEMPLRDDSAAWADHLQFKELKGCHGVLDLQ